MALQGDVSLLRLFVDRQLPRPSDAPVKIGRLPTRTIEDLTMAHQMVVNEVTSGNLNPAQGVQIDALLETSRKVIETEDVVKRLHALEQLQAGDPTRHVGSKGIGIAERLNAGRQRTSKPPSPSPEERRTTA